MALWKLVVLEDSFESCCPFFHNLLLLIGLTQWFHFYFDNFHSSSMFSPFDQDSSPKTVDCPSRTWDLIAHRCQDALFLVVLLLPCRGGSDWWLEVIVPAVKQEDQGRGSQVKPQRTWCSPLGDMGSSQSTEPDCSTRGCVCAGCWRATGTSLKRKIQKYLQENKCSL